jgi:hypothetical protein
MSLLLSSSLNLPNQYPSPHFSNFRSFLRNPQKSFSKNHQESFPLLINLLWRLNLSSSVTTKSHFSQCFLLHCGILSIFSPLHSDKFRWNSRLETIKFEQKLSMAFLNLQKNNSLCSVCGRNFFNIERSRKKKFPPS